MLYFSPFTDVKHLRYQFSLCIPYINFLEFNFETLERKGGKWEGAEWRTIVMMMTLILFYKWIHSTPSLCLLIYAMSFESNGDFSFFQPPGDFIHCVGSYHATSVRQSIITASPTTISSHFIINFAFNKDTPSCFDSEYQETVVTLS